MDGIKYYKGHDNNGNRAVFEVYSEPKERSFGLVQGGGKMVQVVMTNLDQCGKTNLPSIQYALENGYELLKVIPETEYEMYRQIAIIIEELYMNQFTGGFPRIENIEHSHRQLERLIRRYKKEMEAFK